MATTQPSTILPTSEQPRIATLSRTSPTSSPRLSSRGLPRMSPRRIGRRTVASRVGETSTSSTPYYHSFKEGHWLGQLLVELTTKDSEIANLLRLNQGQHISKVLLQQLEKKQELINSYREFLESLVSLVAQSVFLKNPGLVTDMHDPHGIVQDLSTKKCPNLNIFCRLVIEPSLTASPKPDTVTSQRYNGVPVNQLARFCDVAVLKFLDGVTEQTKPQAAQWAIDYISSLLNSLLSSIASHSSTGWYGAPSTRQKKTVSVNIPPSFLLPTPPTVVVVASPPPLDPETGQVRGGPTAFHFPPQSHRSAQEDSRLSPHASGSFSDSHQSESGDSLGSTVDRKSSPTDMTISPTWSNSSSPMLSPQHTRRGPGDSLSEGGGQGLLGSGFRPRSPRLADLKLSQHPSIPEEEEEDGGKAMGTSGSVRVETEPEESQRDDGSRDKEEECEDGKEGADGGEDEEDEVRSKPTGSAKTVPDVDIRAELQLYINAEGRISLIAILQAIARLPQSDVIWTKRFGMNCFQLIQHCMDLGLAQSSKLGKSSSSVKRQRFQKQENTAFLAHGSEQPCQLHSRYVVHYAVHALIQCGTNLLIGCSHDTQQTCWLAYKRVGSQNNLIHPRLLRQLNRIHCHSPQEFQRAMLHFSSTAPLRKILHFLHVVLEYCQMTSAEKVDSLLLSIVSSVFRALVDRLAQLDLSKPSLQESLVSDVCLFIQYAQALFNFHPQVNSYRHFHMYIHRVALSVILPQQEPKSEPSSDSIFQPFPAILEEDDLQLRDALAFSATPESHGLPERGSKVTQSLPRKLKQKTSEEKSHPHSSIQSDHIVLTKSPKAQRRNLFTKQHSIHEREDSSLTLQDVGGFEVSGGMEEWRRLKLKVLRQRIQRLVVLMDLSEPGTVPDPGMLASLIDLSEGTLVVARAMVLLECALFVRKIRRKDGSSSSHWLRNRQEGHHRIAINFKRWAVAIGEKLRIVELRERDKIQQLQRRAGGKSQSIVLPEEPVLPDSPAEPDKQDDKGNRKFQTVSFGIKMCACVLLYEITHYLRDNVTTGSAPLGTPRVSITNIDGGRRPSLISTTSTDTEAIVTPGATGHDSKMLGMARHRLTPDIRSSSLEDETVHSIHSPSLNGASFEGEQPPESPRKRVSVYLRVNSATEQRDQQRGRVNSGLKQTINITSTGDAQQKRRSSVSISVGRRHVSFYEKRPDESPVKTSRPSAVTVSNLRPVPGLATLKASHSFQETPPPESLSPSDSFRRPKLQPQGSTASQKNYNLGSQIQSGISRLARRAFRGKIQRKTTAGARKSSLAGSSPTLVQRKRPQRLSTAGFALGMEDDRRHFPWLEIVEHLVVVDALNPDSHARHSQACTELVTALNHVYGIEEGGKEEARGSSLNSLFSGVLDPFIQVRERGLDNSRGTHVRRTGKHKPPRSVSTSVFSSQSTAASSVVSSQSMASLDFSQIKQGLFFSPFLGQYTTIELFLEQDTEHPETKMDAGFGRARRSYLQESFAGLMHAPLSLLVYTAPLLSSSSFSSLKDMAWGMILDRNQELAQAAGMFFLLAAAREGENAIKEFFGDKGETESPEKQREAVMRFMVLWKVRYKVWPAIGEQGQKRFNSERAAEERQDQTIGYSLPTNLLGSAGREVPVPPWKALSLCIHDDCQTNPDKCYRATRLAPLKHCKEVSEAVKGFTISGISMGLEADSKPTSVFAGVGSEDNAGNININQWEAVEPTLFPPSLLPLISFVVSSLTPLHSGHSSTKFHTSLSFPLSLNRSELASQAIKQCMIEDPRLLFRPLLNRFNRLYQEISDRTNRYSQVAFIKSLKEILHPLHVILQSFPSLPPKAAHFLFNSFIGIITRHTDQPCTFSTEIIQSVLLLLTMVIPSVKGLDLKALKSMLKKESCYTTILTTARIRGTEKINIIDETVGTSTSRSILHDQSVDADDTFGQVIAQFKGTQLSYELLQSLYLVDQSKDLPVLSMLVVKDHYSMLSDKQYPTFVLRDAQRGSGREVWSWGDQMDQLFVHKMSEVLRVLMIFKLLQTGPEVERGSIDIYNKFAQPNYRFLHQELVALNSFPRQALTSILYEAGPASLSHHHLRSSDSMLMGTWVKFVLGLFVQAKPDYDWENSLGLFLNVVNGALLLYSEDLSILRQALAALIVVASKFVNVFQRHGYEMVTPTLIQVYASHMSNKLITNALKFVWGQFYMLNLDSNVFVMQAIAATATLLSEEAAKLSASSGTPLRSSLLSQHLSPALVQGNNARAVFQLLQSLDSENPPRDDLHIMSECPMEQRMLNIHWQPLTLQTTFYLCITVASWNPEAVRGMQVLVFVDHLIPMFLSAISLPRTSTFVLESMKSLVKGCDAITKPQSWKGDFLSSRRDTQQTDTQHNLDLVTGDRDTLPQQQRPSLFTTAPVERKTSRVAKLYRRIVNPSKTEEVSEGSAFFRQTNLDKAISSLQPMGHLEYVGGFKRRLQATNQRVLQLSRESLLSLSSKMVLHEATLLRERSGAGSKTVVRLDAQTTAYLTAIAVQVLKIGGTNEDTLNSQGLCSFMESLLPNIEWTDAHFGSFHNIVNRLVKLFRMLGRVRILLAWDGLTVFLKGITQCIKSCDRLAAQEQIFVKLKMLLEVIVRAPAQERGGGGGQDGSPSQGGNVGRRRPLLHFAPPGFTEAVVKLISQLMVTTKDAPNPRLQYHLSDLLSPKLVITIFPKILLPLCIHLGLREDLERLSEQDLEFLLQLLDKKVENILKLSRPPLHPSHFMDPSRTEIPADMFCRAIKVFCCAFSESFTLTDWSRVAQWIMSLSLRRLEGLRPSKPHVSDEQTGSSSSLLSSTSSRSSRHTSVSGQSNFDSYLAYYKALLTHVYEGLLCVHHIPLFSFIWPLLGQLESLLSEVERCVKVESPVQLQAFRNCIDKCQSLRRQGQSHTARSKNDLLTSYKDELKSPSSHSKFKRASTIIEHSRPPRHPKRRLSYQHSLPSIGEEGGTGNARKGKKRSDARPNFLKFSNPPPEESRSKRAVVVMKGEDLKKRPARASAGETSTKGSVSSTDGVTASKQTSQTSTSFQPKRTAGRKNVGSQQPTALSPLTSPPVEASPRRVRKARKPPAEKQSRNPPLSQLRDDSKFTSSEFQADVEDFDAVSPMEERKTEGCIVTANEMALTPISRATVTIEAEVHLESGERHKLDTKEASITSVSSLILPPPPSPRPSSRSASPISSPSLIIRHFPPLTLSPPPKSHSPRTSPFPNNTTTTATIPPTEGGDSYAHNCSSDLLIPRERADSSPPPPSRDSLHDSSPYETETDTDTLLPRPTSSNSGGSLPRGKALSPNSPTSSTRKLSSVRPGSGKAKGGSVLLNTPGLAEDSDC